jgi:hypothetical protein
MRRDCSCGSDGSAATAVVAATAAAAAAEHADDWSLLRYDLLIGETWGGNTALRRQRMITRNHVLVKCSNSSSCALIVVQNVAEVDVYAGSPALRLGHAVMPMLLRTPLHHQHITIGQFETPLRYIRADTPKRCACTRPHVGHVPQFEVRRGSKGQGCNDRLWPEEHPAVCMPRDLIVAIEVEPQ